jgi:hypothetical protein
LYSETLPALGSLVLKILLIAAPIIGSLLAAFTKQYYASGDYLVLRAGAEEIMKELYTFRTVLKKSPERRAWLEKRVADIQRQVYRGLGGEMTFQDYPSQIPPYYDPENPNSDPGFDDLTGEQYFHYRLETQLAWHMVKVSQIHRKRVGLQIFILLVGASGAFLAAMGGSLSLWVALTSSLGAALISWQELRNQDFIVKNYSKVIVELGIMHDHWTSLEPEERTDGEFFKMVQSTEDILWGQNVEYIKSMQEALVKLSLDEEADLVNSTIRKAREADARFKRARRDTLVGAAAEAMDDAGKAMAETFDAAVGSLAEEASSEIVQQELAAMGQAVTQAAEALVARGSRFRHSLDEIAAEFANVKVGKETPTKVLNEMIARFPPTGEVKG